MNKLEKENLRKEYKLIRSRVENKKEKSQKIADKVRMLEDYKNAKIIAIYKSFSFEVDTTDLVHYALEDNKIVCLPKIENDEMKFYKITEGSRFIKNKFGIEEPEEYKENFIDKSFIDLAIIPGLCFDTEKNRLGFGKGYYDRYLENTKIKTVGICFNEQILENELLPTTYYDVKMDLVITDKKQIK